MTNHDEITLADQIQLEVEELEETIAPGFGLGG